MALFERPLPVPTLLKLPRSDSPLIVVGWLAPEPTWPALPLPVLPPRPPPELLPPLDPPPNEPDPPIWAWAEPHVASQAVSPKARTRIRMTHLVDRPRAYSRTSPLSSIMPDRLGRKR